MKSKSKLAAYFKSLQWKILLLTLLAGILPAILLTVGFLHFFQTKSLKNLSQEMVETATVMDRKIVTSGFVTNPTSDEVSIELKTIAASYDGRALVISPSLKVVYDTYGIDDGKTIIWENVIRAEEGETVVYHNGDYITVTCPIMLGSKDEEEASGVLLLNRSLFSVEDTLAYTCNIAIVIFVVSLMLLLVAGLLISRHFTRPLRKLIKNMDESAQGQFTEEPVLHDYTEMEELSEHFNSFTGRMQTIDESRQEFVSNVSHELKTPLTSMKVLADSLNSMEGAPVEMYQEFMQDITHEIDRETQIINDLLSLVKMDKSQAKLNISAININDMIELILKRLKPIAEKQEVDLVLETFRPVVAEIDEVKMTLAITNLVENGIKYNNPQGWVHVTVNADHQYCFIRVEDNGMGMPREALEHIFERFYRVDKSHSREIGGTGLGLAITHDAILMHHGEIRVDSELDKGTTFDVRIPLNYLQQS